MVETAKFSLYREVFTTPDGVVERHLIRHPGAVAIIARPDRDHLLMVRQYRYAIRRWTWEIPAGTCDPGESVLGTARRELAEETGYRAERWQTIGAHFPAVGASDEVMTFFLAEGLSLGATDPDHGELVETAAIPLQRVPALRASGELCDGKTLYALALLGYLPDGIDG